MDKLWKLQRDALVLVCDGRKAVFLVNDGPATQPDLKVRDVMEAKAAAEPSDRPGRRPDRRGADGGKGSLSGMEMPDPHALEAEAFVREIAERLARAVAADAPPAIVLAAAPDVLGALRKHMPENAASLILAEFPKDLAHLPVDRIAAAILDM